MREHRMFFGIPLTKKDCLGWALQELPFEIIENRTRGTVRVVKADWLKKEEPLTQLACLFVALADKAETMAAIKRPVRSGSEMCDGGPGLAPPRGGLADREHRYFVNKAQAGLELQKLFNALPKIIDACCAAGRNFETYMWINHFFNMAAEYWPSEFEKKQAAVLKLLESDAVTDCHQFDKMEPSKLKASVHDAAIELFMTKFSDRHRVK